MVPAQAGRGALPLPWLPPPAPASCLPRAPHPAQLPRQGQRRRLSHTHLKVPGALGPRWTLHLPLRPSSHILALPLQVSLWLMPRHPLSLPGAAFLTRFSEPSPVWSGGLLLPPMVDPSPNHHSPSPWAARMDSGESPGLAGEAPSFWVCGLGRPKPGRPRVRLTEKIPSHGAHGAGDARAGSSGFCRPHPVSPSC